MRTATALLPLLALGSRGGKVCVDMGGTSWECSCDCEGCIKWAPHLVERNKDESIPGACDGTACADYDPNFFVNCDYDSSCVVGDNLFTGNPQISMCYSDPTPKPAPPSVSGDPFAERFGKKVQFFLPPGREMMLAKCGGVGIRGRTMSSTIPGDTSQWFDRFSVTAAAGGEELMSVETAGPRLLAAAAVTEAADAADGADVVVGVPGAADAGGARVPLTTLNVTVLRRRVARTGAVAAGDGGGAPAAVGGIEVSAARLPQRIGDGHREVVHVRAGDVRLAVRSAVAGKLAADADRVRHVHLDLEFRGDNEAECDGILPQIWGVRKMSAETAQLLFPAQK